ncbi:MAG TPA: tyrosine--tRNA ligase [Caldisericia bacterium]|nr:tyrosine--tRNA ligase [Caldisericia bacterium]
MGNYKEQFREILKGTKEIIDQETLEKKLFLSEKNNVPLTVKLGTDPTAPSLHLGHMVPVHKLKQFQDFGHNVIFLFGDFTARIGDPTGRSTKRNMLTREEVDSFAKGYLNQIFKVLKQSKTKIHYNSEWFERINIYDFIGNIASKYTVAQLLARDDFNTRYNSNKPIALSEFLYPLLQAYDSVALKADVEIGGNDQLFNFMVARQLQSQFNQNPEVIITLPTIKGIDGHEKMSKSLENTINLDDSPEEMYGKIMSINDEVMLEYYQLLSSKGSDYIKKIKDRKLHPKEAKEELAFEMTSIYHSVNEAIKEKNRFYKKFVRKEIPEDLEKILIKSRYLINVVDLIYKTGKVNSKNEAKRLILQKGVRIDGSLVENQYKNYGWGEYVLNIGKRKYVKIILENEN